MEKIPRIYCLSIPGSDRMDGMRRQFDNLGLSYEFVHGKVWDYDDVPFSDVCESTHTCRKDVSHEKRIDYLRRIYGCKEGHIRLLEKALGDGCEYIISCEDDIDLGGEKFIPFIRETMKDIDGLLRGMCNINGSSFQGWIGNIRSNQKYHYSYDWCTDSIYLLNRKGMQFYLDGLCSTKQESDMGMCKYLRDNKTTLPIVHNDFTPIRLSDSHK